MSELSLSKIIPQRRKTIKFLWCKKDWMKFRLFKDARIKSGMSVKGKCDWCSHKFSDDEMMGIACPEKDKNMLLCGDCCESMLNNNLA